VLRGLSYCSGFVTPQCSPVVVRGLRLSLVLSNGSTCPLSVADITTTSTEFALPTVASYPILIGPGDAVALPIRFAPTSFGTKSATIKVFSDDPASPGQVSVRGQAPSGKIAVTGSTHFGRVRACCVDERMIAICNTGDCKLDVSSVAFRRKSRHWKLVNNPFPATLHPGSCLNVVIRYKATEKFARSCDLLIHSDDPAMPTLCLELLASTVWPEVCCDDSRAEPCKRRCREPSCCTRCCDDHDCRCDDTDDEDDE